MTRYMLLFIYSAIILITIPAATADPDKNGSIPVMIDVPQTTFQMGRSANIKGESDELPRHTVHLRAHQIGKYEITNAQYVAVLNWAKDKGYLETNPLSRLTGRTDENIYHAGRLLKVINKNSQIILENGRYTPIMREGLFMDNHPVADVTWSGAVVYANWLSEIQQLTPCYNLKTFKRIAPTPNGYRLPTEAEWEHAAGTSQSENQPSWNYATTTHTLTEQQGNYQLQNPLNKVGMSTHPFTTPIGYFDGLSLDTQNARSPIGCYDMSGNVQEWCEDWFSEYTPKAKTDPTGPKNGSYKVVRGGAWNSMKSTCRTSNRGWTPPSNHYRSFGFRLARTP